MKSAHKLDYTIHHLCVYDKDSRNHIWPYLRWHHGITGYFWGDTYHIAQEGHADYTFLGCGGRAFQVQLEAPPYQFRYEQEWYKKHGNTYNHICWVVNDAKSSFEQLQAAGASIMQEYTEFPTYNGFVMADPEGRWVEIMEYSHPTFRVQEFTNQPAGPCGLQMIGFGEIVNDLAAMEKWYIEALDMRKLFEYKVGKQGIVYLTDKFYDAETRNTIMALSTARTTEEKQALKQHGPYISSVIYQALDVHEAFADALAAGLEPISEPALDEWTGALTARLREPSGNTLELRERLEHD